MSNRMYERSLTDSLRNFPEFLELKRKIEGWFKSHYSEETGVWT